MKVKLSIGTVELAGETPVAYDAPTEKIEMAVTQAILSASEVLPVGAVFEIRGKLPPTGTVGNYGRALNNETDADRLRRRTAEWGVAWYCAAGMPQEPLFRAPVSEAKEHELGGFLVIARLKVAA